MKEKGFTLIEILIVIGIIGVLASVILGNVNTAREKGMTAKVKSELRNIRTAIALLADDTGKWPNGCPIGSSTNPEVALDDAQAGIKERPSAGDQGDGCIWTASDVANWNGPYMDTPVDPWGNSYDFDPDYRPGDNLDESLNCDETNNTVNDIVAIVSYGEDGIGRNRYNCDDIYLELR